MNLEPIDTSTTAGKARVMQLAADGRKVVAKAIPKVDEECYCPWMKLSSDIKPVWNWQRSEYAIISDKVGPSCIWATVIDGNVVMDVYSTEQEADAALNRGWEKVKYIRADLAGEVS